MKRIKSILLALLFSITLPAFAHAVPSPFFQPYAEIYTVASSGSTVQDTSFTGTELPYLYVEFYNPPKINVTEEITLTLWSNTSLSTFNIYPTGITTSGNQAWISLPQAYWNTINSTPGTWSISAATGTWDRLRLIGSLYGTTSFTDAGAGFHLNSAPEPMGTILFLLGGTLMAINIIRRKKALARV